MGWVYIECSYGKEPIFKYNLIILKATFFKDLSDIGLLSQRQDFFINSPSGALDMKIEF